MAQSPYNDLRRYHVFEYNAGEHVFNSNYIGARKRSYSTLAVAENELNEGECILELRMVRLPHPPSVIEMLYKDYDDESED